MSNTYIDEPKKLWNHANKTTVNLTLTISGKRSRMYFSKDLIRVLGGPSYICLKVKQTYDSVVVMPCDSKMYLSFKVPENLLLVGHTHMEVASMGFVQELLYRNGLESDATYSMEGRYLEKNNAVVFQLAHAEKHEDTMISEA